MKFKFMKFILNIVLSIACVAHIAINAYYALYPDIPSMKQYKTDLGKIVFPVSFTICVRENLNQAERYKDFGYERVWEFYSGKNRIREGVFGWNGDFENGSSLTVKGIKTRQSISGSVLKRDQRETKDRPETDLGDRQTKNIKIVSSRKVFIRKSNTSIS